MSEIALSQSIAISPVAPVPQNERLWQAAQTLEASFLSEVLKFAGVSEVPGAFGGGIGEEHFASFLRDEQASAIVDAGGIGLAESLYEAMKRSDNG